MRAVRNQFSDRKERSRRVFVAKDDAGQARGKKVRRNNHGEHSSAGDMVRESGIYEVIHDNQHRSAHEVEMIANEMFPLCEVCFERVKYRVVRTAPYIFTDEDFEEPMD